MASTHCVVFGTSRTIIREYKNSVRYNKNKYNILERVLVEKSSLELWLSTSAAPRLIITFLGMIFSTSTLSRMLYLYNITRCYSNGEYCHVFAIAAGDIIKYQGGHMMRNADARTVRSRQETFNSNGGHDTWFGDFKHQITSLFMVRNTKCGYSFS